MRWMQSGETIPILIRFPYAFCLFVGFSEQIAFYFFFFLLFFLTRLSVCLPICMRLRFAFEPFKPRKEKKPTTVL